MACNSFSTKARNRVTIQKRTDTVSDYGGVTPTWSTLSKVWAIMEPVSGRESYVNAKLLSTVTHKITIRYISDIKVTDTAATHRILYDGRYFNIKYIRNLHDDMKTEGKEYQVMLCVEGEPQNG